SPAQSPWPAPSQSSQLPAAQSPFPAPSQQTVFPGGPGGGFGGGPGGGPGGGLGGGFGGGGPPPQQAAQCANFPKLRDAARAKADVIQAVGKRHGDRKEMCTAVQTFTTAEAAVVKFLKDNKTACGVPDQAVGQAEA